MTDTTNEDTYPTLTPFGVVLASFPEEGGCLLDGPADAVAHIQRVMRDSTDSRGMLMSLDSVEPHDYFHFCQPEGSGIVILEPFDVMFARLQEEAGQSVAVLDAVSSSVLQGLQSEFKQATSTLRKLEIARAILELRVQAYTPFAASKIKMPTALQLGLDKKHQTVLFTRNGELMPGWSNGMLLDVVKRPQMIEDAIAKYHGGDPKKADTIRRFDETNMQRVMDTARHSKVEVQPTALRAGKRPAVVLSSEKDGIARAVDLKNYAYFAKTYPGAQFFASPEETRPVLVKHNGQEVGAILGMTLSTQELLKRGVRPPEPKATEEEGAGEQYPEDVVAVYETRGGKNRMIVRKSATPGRYSYEGDYGGGSSLTPADLARRVETFRGDFPTVKLVYGTAAADLPGEEAPAPAAAPRAEVIEGDSDNPGGFAVIGADGQRREFRGEDAEALVDEAREMAVNTGKTIPEVVMYLAEKDGWLDGTRTPAPTPATPTQTGTPGTDPAGAGAAGGATPAGGAAGAGGAGVETPGVTPSAADPQLAADRALLEQVAAGSHPDMLEPELADQIEAAVLRHPDNAELQALGERAINAYSQGLMQAAEAR